MRAHLARASEDGLVRAYELGRKALNQQLGVIEIGAIYYKALSGVLRLQRKPADSLKALTGLFLESLTPYEMTHRGYRDAHATLRRLNDLLEDEAKRIARALHDESGQLLVAVHLALEELAQTLPDTAQGQIEKVRATLDDMEKNLRRLSRDLRPPLLDDLGVYPALRFLSDDIAKRTGLNIRFKARGTGRLPPRVETALYRLVQEALTNVSKHAKATSVSIEIRRPSRSLLRCSIRDDGVGFDSSRVVKEGIRRGLGLPGMQERLASLGATLEIKSAPGQGTVLLAEVPIESRHAG